MKKPPPPRKMTREQRLVQDRKNRLAIIGKDADKVVEELTEKKDES
jgi:hypothetical protein